MSYVKGRNKQRGVTLFELLLVLFVAAFVAVAVATIYNRVNTTYKTKSLFEDIQRLSGEIRSLYAGQGDYTGLDFATISTAGVIPSGMVSNNNPVHPFDRTNGSWSIASTSGDSEFTITVNKLPKDVCVDMATKAIGLGDAVQTSGGGSISNVSDAIGACGSDSNSLLFVYN